MYKTPWVFIEDDIPVQWIDDSNIDLPNFFGKCEITLSNIENIPNDIKSIKDNDTKSQKNLRDKYDTDFAILPLCYSCPENEVIVGWNSCRGTSPEGIIKNIIESLDAWYNTIKHETDLLNIRSKTLRECKPVCKKNSRWLRWFYWRNWNYWS